jgi:SAF domain
VDSPRGGSTVTAPPARRVATPRWTDTRLLLGVVLVLASVVVGTRVVATAEQTRPVWAAARDLPAGVTVRADDVVPAQVRLDGTAAHYLDAGTPVVGRTLQRAVVAGELLPAAAVPEDGQQQPGHLLSVAVQSGHLPPGLDRGDAVDVYVTTDDAASSRRVLSSATVVDVADAGVGLRDPSADVTVVLDVPDGAVPDLVAAVRSGDVDLVGVVAR